MCELEHKLVSVTNFIDVRSNDTTWMRYCDPGNVLFNNSMIKLIMELYNRYQHYKHYITILHVLNRVGLRNRIRLRWSLENNGFNLPLSHYMHVSS